MKASQDYLLPCPLEVEQPPHSLQITLECVPLEVTFSTEACEDLTALVECGIGGSGASWGGSMRERGKCGTQVARRGEVVVVATATSQQRIEPTEHMSRIFPASMLLPATAAAPYTPPLCVAALLLYPVCCCMLYAVSLLLSSLRGWIAAGILLPKFQ